MADGSGKVETQIELNAKDNASGVVSNVTKQFEHLKDAILTVDGLLENLSKNVEKTFGVTNKAFEGLPSKRIDQINRAVENVNTSARTSINQSRSEAKNKVDIANAAAINAKTNSGYYDAFTSLTYAKAQNALDQLAISANKASAAESRKEASQNQLQTALTKKGYWDAQTRKLNSPEYYEEMRSRNRSRDVKTQLNQRKLEEGDEKESLRKRRDILEGARKISNSVSSFNDPAGVSKVVGGVAESFTKVLSASTKLGSALTLVAEGAKVAAKIFNESIEAFQNIEVIKTNLGVISGSQIEGDRLFGDIAQYAIKSPFGIKQTAEQATLLKQSGVYAEDLMDTLSMIGDLAGGNEEKMRRISNDYSHIVSNGKANMLQLRQFATAGIPIYKELSKELGVSNETVRKMVKNGEIGADKIEKVLKNLTSEGGVFYQSVEKGSKTLKARTTNLADARTLAFSEYGRTILGVGSKEGTDGILMKMLTIQEEFFKWSYKESKNFNDKEELKKIKDKEKEYDKAVSEMKNAYKNKTANSYILELTARAKAKELNFSLSDENVQEAYFKSFERQLEQIEYQREMLRDLDVQIAETEERLKRNDLNDVTRLYLQENLPLLKEERDFTTSQLLAERQKIGKREYQAASNAYFNKLYTSSSEILEKGGKQDKSLWSVTDEMLNLQKQTAEWKEKEAAEQKKMYENTKKTAQELAKITNSEDIVDLSKISTITQFKKYAQLFTEGEEFDLNTLNYNPLSTEDQKRATVVNNQFQSALLNAIRLLGTADKSMLENEDFKTTRNFLASLIGKNFLNDSQSWNEMFTKYYKKLDELSKGNGTQKDIANLFNSIVNPIITGEIIGNTNAKDIDISKLNSKEIQPLWARIIGSGLGLDAKMVKDTGRLKTLQKHEEEQYTRNITKSVLSAASKAGTSGDSLFKMMALFNPATKKADASGEKEYQLDWMKTQKNIKAFALQLGQAADVTSAYVKSVESEIDTLSNLLASMPTTFEEASNVKGFDDLFINAFTGRVKLGKEDAYYDAETKMVTTFKGVKYSIDDVKDKIVFAEGTIKELTKQLKNRRADLIEAKRAEAVNQSLEEGRKSFQEKYFSYLAVNKYGLSTESSQYKNLMKQAQINLESIKYDDYQWNDAQNKYIASGKAIDDANKAEKERLKLILEESLKDQSLYSEEYNKAKTNTNMIENQLLMMFGSSLGLKNFTSEDVRNKLKDPATLDNFNKFKEENKNKEIFGTTLAKSISESLKSKSVFDAATKAVGTAFENYSNAEETTYEQDRKVELLKNADIKLSTNMEVLSDVLEKSLGENSTALISLDRNTKDLDNLVKNSEFAKSLNYMDEYSNLPVMTKYSMNGSGYDFFKNENFTRKYGFDQRNLKGISEAFTTEIYKNFMDNPEVATNYFNKISGNVFKKGSLGTDLFNLIGNRATAEMGLLQMQKGSNVNLLSGITSSSTYNKDGRYANFSSVKADGTKLTAAELKKYVEDYFATGNDVDRLLIGEYSSLEDATKNAEELKNLQETFFNSNVDKSVFKLLAEDAVLFQSSITETAKRMDDLKKSMSDTFESFITGNVVSVFETIGESMVATTDASSAWKSLGKSFVSAVDEMTGKLGELMITAGLTELISGDKGLGIALLAVGGLSSIVSGMLDNNDDDENEEKIKKLEALKSDLKDLIAQAKADAIYYEQNLSNRNALAANQAISVNDAIITPNGNVISTHPDDYLIATKTPGSLVNGNNSSPVVNLNIVNNSGQQLSVKQTKTESNGQINIEAIIEGVVGKGIAEGSFDGALSARESRIKGSSVYM